MRLITIHAIAVAAALVAGTVSIHSAGSFYFIWVFKKHRASTPTQPDYARLTARLTGVVFCLLFLHLLECALWAAFFYLSGCFSNLVDSMYFSLITYATVGYGDVVLSQQWRLLGGVEALTGMMMMSWSTAILIGFVQSLFSRQLK